jgi:hypothetical protein
VGLRTAAGDGFGVFVATGVAAGPRTGAAAWATGVTVQALPRMTISTPLAVSALQRGQRFGPVRGFHNLFQFDARLTQRTLDYFAHHRGVIHDERSCLIHGLHHSAVYAGRPRNRLRYFLTHLMNIGSPTLRFREAATRRQAIPRNGSYAIGTPCPRKYSRSENCASRVFRSRRQTNFVRPGSFTPFSYLYPAGIRYA